MSQAGGRGGQLPSCASLSHSPNPALCPTLQWSGLSLDPELLQHELYLIPPRIRRDRCLITVH